MDKAEHYGPGQPMNAADVAAIIDERDRLLAVVEAVELVLAVARHIAAEYDPEVAHVPVVEVPLGLMQALQGNLDQLDVSGEATGG